jgi:phosphohistidine phosphatase
LVTIKANATITTLFAEIIVMDKTLTLIRHAEAVWNHRDGDHQRPLSQQGFDYASCLAHELKRCSVVFDQIHCSDACRTEQTMTLLNQQLNCPQDHVFIRDDLYCASARTLMEIIQQLDNHVHHVAIVAHNPGLTECCGELVGHNVATFAPAAAVTLNLSVDDWRAVIAGIGTCHQTISV